VSEYNDKPLVSIITVCYNSEKYIRETIESVLNQTYDNIEYIIVDGDSTDSTLDIIKEYEPKFNGRLRWVSEPDEGIYDAMNKGINMATGYYAFFIGADDIFLKDNLEQLMHKIKHKKTKRLLVFPIILNNSKNYPKLDRKVNIVHHQGVLFNLNIIKEIGCYNKKYMIHSDFDLISKYIKKYGYIYINIPLCKFTKGGVSTNGENVILSTKELIKIYKYYNGDLFSFEFIKLISRPLFYYLKEKVI
jgi:glycosyltransferase involved in cell wall biosynthesis